MKKTTEVNSLQTEKVQTVTLGCRLNAYESDVIQAMLQDGSKNRKIIVLNTCSVTREAEKESQRKARTLCRDFPHAALYVTGCDAQLHPKAYERIPGIKKIVQNNQKLDASEYIENLQVSQKPFALGLKEKVRGSIEIQNGCNHRCTFCIIPFARGENRSIPERNLLEKIGWFIDFGYQEIILSGVDITDYGRDTGGTFSTLVCRILKVYPELKRLGFSSIDVSEVDNKLIQLIAEEKRLASHLHLSLQAGDNLILKRMRRRHTREDVRDFVNTVRAIRTGMLFTADIIAGFPTETEEMFSNTVDLLETLGFCQLHVFPYSAREGTPASRMPQVPRDVIKRRARILRELSWKNTQDHYQKLLGTVQEVLFETPIRGKTSQHLDVTLGSGIGVKGSFAEIKIERIENKMLVGSLAGFKRRD